MATSSKITFEEFQKLQAAADDAARYELDEGEVILTPSPTPWHNIISLRLWRALADFTKIHDLGLVLTETDFRLPSAIRRPDVAFIAKRQLLQVNPHQTPIEVAPTLAIEVISPSNSAVDTRKRLRQYLDAGAQAVWLVYPDLRLCEIYDHSGVREFTQPDTLQDDTLFPSLHFSLSLTELFDENLTR